MRRDEHRHRRPRKDPEPGVERRVALHGLEELREQEDRAEHPEEHEQGRDVRAANVRLRKKRIGSIGSRVRSSQSDERGEEREPERRSSRRSRAAPADRVPADEAPDDPEEAGARERRGRAGRAASGPVGLLRRRTGQRDEHEADRHVEPEDPLPREPFDDGAADQRAERDARPPMPPHAPSASPRRSGGTAAERIVSVRGVTIAPPSPCTARASDQRLDRRRERSGRGGDREDPEPMTKIRRRPKRSPSAAPGEEQHRERQRVGVDRPLELARSTRRGRCGSRAAPS